MAGSTSSSPGEILFVDDEEPIARLGQDLLDLLGFRALSVTSPRRALELIEKEPDRFCLLIVDLRMQEMNGLDLVNGVRQTKPDFPVILMSGLWDSNIILELKRTKKLWSLSKPFTARDLEVAVRQALSGN
jgi:DNA-binding NtrC family response regulator